MLFDEPVHYRPPFTLQRLTEVILDPQKSYKTLNKLINALEKVRLLILASDGLRQLLVGSAHDSLVSIVAARRQHHPPSGGPSRH